jgi:hypothetical protein
VGADLVGYLLDPVPAFWRLLAIPVDPATDEHAENHPGDGSEPVRRPLDRGAGGHDRRGWDHHDGPHLDLADVDRDHGHQHVDAL